MASSFMWALHPESGNQQQQHVCQPTSFVLRTDAFVRMPAKYEDKGVVNLVGARRAFVERRRSALWPPASAKVYITSMQELRAFERHKPR